ncbi:nitrogen-specific signal transduction histidine kinase [Melghirimyces profundicolus]|uniref:histidine kinase n=1 Tax=Melghirimyces profundicolus TaxID=1242148 RepID=A0A2T6BAJ3_9BACL|nr:ATP-binding protein [Melghirimyces profundicolus]PTX53085.1 nitrogen-specific signal transduction histidine kinase [Melghirimyces profundicolus]
MNFNGDADRKLPIAFDLDIHAGLLGAWVENLPQSVLLVDEQGTVEAVSPNFLRELRLEKEQVVGSPCERFLALPCEVMDYIRRPAAWNSPESIKGILRPDISDPCSAMVQLLSGTCYGRWYHMLLINRDDLVTRHAETILERLPVGVILSKHSEVKGINSVALKMIGAERKEVEHREMDRLFSGLREGEGLEEIRKQIAIGEPFRGLSASWTLHNSPVVATVDFDVLGRDPEGHPEETILTMTDISQIHLLDQQVRQTDRLAMIGQIAAGTAHEIRNPLTSIRGFLQVMRHVLNEKGDLKGQGYTEIMLREIDRINSLVGEFLLMSKPRDLKKQPVALDRVIRELLPIIENEAILHNIEVRYVKEGLCPPVRADAEVLKQVVLNLCKNGIEAMGEGGFLTIRLSCDREAGQLILEVEDNGPGIPASDMKRIFDPFYTTKENGTGLGLPVCRRIIQDLNGDIQVRSGERGALFRVLLPFFPR